MFKFGLIMDYSNSVFLLDLFGKNDQVYSNTRVSTQVNTSQHESTRVRHESTRVRHDSTRINTNQHVSDTSQYESDTIQHESARV